jgi:ATP/maltotriose-dependent transcriptional regulator MalT
MRFWNLFTKKRRIDQLKESIDQNIKKLEETHSQFSELKNHIQTTDLLLQRHDQLINEQGLVLKNHSKQIQSLETLVARSPVSRTEAQASTINNKVRSSSGIYPSANKESAGSDMIDMTCFSQQERKILSVFFQHPDMGLSYRDISEFLHKSPHTIKNQLRQIRMKADLFTQSTDQGSRNRFRLKEGLKIDNILNLKQTTSQPDPSD